MFANGDPSVSTALKEFTTACNEYLEHTFTGTVQKTDVRMAIGMNNNTKALDTLHMRDAGNGWVNWQLGVEYSHIRATGDLG